MAGSSRWEEVEDANKGGQHSLITYTDRCRWSPSNSVDEKLGTYHTDETEY